MELRDMLQILAKQDGSDLYLSTGAPPCAKFNGALRPLNEVPLEPGEVARIAAELMDSEQKQQFEKELEMNLAISLPQIGRFRVNIFKQRNEVSLVARNIKTEIPRFEDLKLPPVLLDTIMEKRGLVLFVGGTGSGKSTSLAALIDHRNRNSGGHIITIEDPVEFVHRHRKSIINQREVGVDTRSFHAALKNTLRQAPDVILIGEIRDRETMQAAISYAQTGHLCLATLHANNAYHALNRIVNFFPIENRQLLYLDLAVALRCIVSQRLVRKPDGKRVPAVEILMNTRHISELIERGELNGIKEAMEQSLAPSSQTFEQALYQLYTEKTITLEEALANADSPTNLHWLINNAQINEPESPSLKSAREGKALDFEGINEEGASFKEFTLDMSNN